MESKLLQAKNRDLTGKKVKKLREQGLLPAVIYGHGIKSQSLTIPTKEFDLVYKIAGSSSLVDLQIDNSQPVKILIHRLQKDPVTEEPLHADLYKIKMTEKIKTEIPVHFIGESKAVKEMDGNFITNKDMLEIECLPNDLIDSVEVDISHMDNFGDKIKVSEINIPETVTVLDDPEEIVATVEEPRSEEELKELEEEAKEEEQVEQVETVEKKEAEEGEEAAEGESPAEATPEKPKEKVEEKK